jgi:hypothetical protein
MGFFSSGSKDEHHGDECRDRSGAWWAKPNPMGWGSNEARVIKAAGGSARREQTPTMHGSKGEWNLMSGFGGATDWGRDSDPSVHVTGEKPGGGKQR